MTIDTSEPKLTRFCRLKKQVQKGYLYAIGFSAEAFAIWFTYIVTRFATSVPVTSCPGGEGAGACPPDVALALALSLVITGFILACYLAELYKQGFTGVDQALYIALLPLMIAFAVSFAYLFIVGGVLAVVVSGIMIFIGFESTLSIPAIIVGVIVVATLGYGAVVVACEIEKKRGHSL